MKKAFTTWWKYLIGFILALIPSCIGIITYFVALKREDLLWPFEYIRYVFLFSAVVYFGIGFIWQDLLRARQRHKTKNWVDKLPDQVLDTCWGIFVPFIVASGLCLLAGIIFSLPFVSF